MKMDLKQDYLSKSNCDYLKGILAVCVLLHHLYQQSGLFRHTVIGTGLLFLGSFSVGTFFFLSGYGLMLSLKTKGSAYLKEFPRKRLLPYYVMVIFLTAVYTVYRLAVRDSIGVPLVIQSLLFGGTVILNGWYLQAQLLFYVLFYLVFRFSRSRSAAMMLMTVLTAVYIGIMIVLEYPFVWYVSIPLFVLGLYFAERKPRFDEWIADGKRGLLSFLGGGLAIMAGLLGYRQFEGGRIADVCLTMAECGFLLCVLLTVSRVRIDCMLTRLLGRISLEIYVMQGMCLSWFHSSYWNIENPYWYVFAATVSTVLLAIAVHPVIKKIFSLCGGNRGASKQYKTGKV